jgi:hypothetical protein
MDLSGQDLSHLNPPPRTIVAIMAKMVRVTAKS